MDLGPVEYVIIEFPGNEFNGRIAPEIAKLVEAGTVRILDLIFLKKDLAGTVSTFEFSELDEAAAFVEIEGQSEGFLGEDDLAWAADTLDPDSSALFILWEDLWATDLAREIWRANGELLVGQRVPRSVVNDVVETIERQEASAS
jgi:hypothetical protein